MQSYKKFAWTGKGHKLIDIKSFILTFLQVFVLVTQIFFISFSLQKCVFQHFNP